MIFILVNLRYYFSFLITYDANVCMYVYTSISMYAFHFFLYILVEIL